MSDDEPLTEAEEQRARAELEVLTPEPHGRWRGELGAALGAEAGRRGIGGPRPAMLWGRAGALLGLGVLLLVLAAGRV